MSSAAKLAERREKFRYLFAASSVESSSAATVVPSPGLPTTPPNKIGWCKMSRKRDAEKQCCEICLNEYTDVGDHEPVILTGCGHTYCRVCLGRVEKLKKIKCPACNLVTNGPAKTLPKNFALISAPLKAQRVAVGAPSPTVPSEDNLSRLSETELKTMNEKLQNVLFEKKIASLRKDVEDKSKIFQDLSAGYLEADRYIATYTRIKKEKAQQLVAIKSALERNIADLKTSYNSENRRRDPHYGVIHNRASVQCPVITAPAYPPNFSY
jgi:hypothetical protein